MHHRVVLHMTPNEAWSHGRTNVSTFRLFCSPTRALIPYETQKSMEMKRQPLIFVHFCEYMKVYRLFDPISKEVFFERATHFDEVFNPTPSPSPPSNSHDDNSVGHAHSFSFVEEEEDNQHIEDEKKLEENLQSTITNDRGGYR
jgi:hypothetical protein